MPDPQTFLDSPLVVELGSRISVGLAGSLLAQLGATVVVVEPNASSSKGKWARRPLAMAGKRSLCVNRESDRGRNELSLLLANADIVLTSSDIDTGDREIWANPPQASTIVCDVTAFGHTGPLAGTPFSDGLVQAVSGIIDTTGEANKPPLPIGTPLLEVHSALYAASAILAARRVRQRQGAGQKIDVALFDVGVTSLVNFLPLAILKRTATRSGNRHPLYTPWGTYRTADGVLLICAVTDAHWRAICEVMGKPELVEHSQFSSSDARLRNFQAVDLEVGDWMSRITLAEAERALLAKGIPCGPVVTGANIDRDANILHRRSIATLIDPATGDAVKLPASPIRATPVSGRSPTSIPIRDEYRPHLHALQAVHPGRKNAAAVRNQSWEGIADSPTDLPFAGVRIVEIGQYTVAPLASRILGALGADVVKIESPTGDATRSAAPFREDGASYIFAISNTDKRGIILDLKQPQDRQRLDDLLKTSDALVENLKPGSLVKLGFGSDDLRRRHPHLIFCSVNGFGNDSAYPGRPALDTVVQAMSGLMDVTHVEGRPIKAGISASDNLGGQFALLALCAALELKERMGVAVHFDLSMQDATVWATQLEWSDPEKRSPAPDIRREGDRYVALDTPDASLRSEKSVDDAACAVPTETRATQLAPVLSVEQVFGHQQTIARQLLKECPTVDGDRWRVFSLPFKLLGSSAAVRTVMGRLGADDHDLAQQSRKHLAQN